MSLHDMMRRAREREHPPTPELECARQKMIAKGNHPSVTESPAEEIEDANESWYLQYKLQVKKQLAEAIGVEELDENL